MSWQRLVLVLEFDGTAFAGWQRQANAQGVQEVLEEALARIEGRRIATVASGRTDAGVHAEALPVHADVDAARWRRSPRAYVQGLNQLLPPALRVLAAHAVAADFDARRDCLARVYCYRIWTRPVASALCRWRHWWMPRPLDLSAMHEAACALVGGHAFAAFRAAGCQAAHPHRFVQRLELHPRPWGLEILVQADAFLYRMVRFIVGALVEVGLHRRSPDWVRTLIARGAPRPPAAPAHGLYFVDAIYADFSARALAASVCAVPMASSNTP